MLNTDRPIQTLRLPVDRDTVAPDSADIRVLLRTGQASLAHGTLDVGRTSIAVAHRTVDEMWFVVGGSAEVWRRLGDEESLVTVSAGDALTVPLGADFQYRTVGDALFQFIMCTTPAWPGPDEAIFVEGRWDR